MTWSPALVAQVRQPAAGSRFSLLTLEVHAEVAQAFHLPGQYHRIKVSGAPEGLYAIASGPHASRFDYLIKHSPTSQPLVSLSPGSTVEVTLPEGRGFPLEAAKGHDLVLIGTGSGFAPLKATLDVVRRTRSDFGRVRLIWGVQSPADLVWASEFDAWRHDDLTVVVSVSRPGRDWAGAVGHVQQHLDGISSSAHVFLCGQKQMVSDVTAVLVQQGVQRDRISLNF